jgi:cytochrome b involved in lipid metabolism
MSSAGAGGGAGAGSASLPHSSGERGKEAAVGAEPSAGGAAAATRAGESAVHVGATGRTRQELEALACHVRGDELEFSMAEVARHNSKADCWLVAHGEVYDVTEFLRRGLHPGGEQSIARYAGTDATVHFDFHGHSAHRIWGAYRIGHVAGHSSCAIA